MRRRRDKPTLVIHDMPKEICDVLKRLAKRDKLSYTKLCRLILTEYAQRALNPRRRP